jgi:serine/threonine protein kinase
MYNKILGNFGGSTNQYAIKILKVENDEVVSEIAIHKNIKHKNIVRLHDSFFDEMGKLHIVMDICESDIQKYLDSGDRINSFYSGMMIARF